METRILDARMHNLITVAALSKRLCCLLKIVLSISTQTIVQQRATVLLDVPSNNCRVWRSPATLVQPHRAPPKPRPLARDGQVAPRHTEQNNQAGSVLNKGSTEQSCLLFLFRSLIR